MNGVSFFDPGSSNNTGKISGTVEFHQCNIDTMTRIIFKLSGFKPNTIHGCHIHTSGDLTQGCKSACAHYNPMGFQHGNSGIFGKNRHHGDTCNNIVADANGMVNYTYQDDLIDLIGEFSVIGRMVVLHDKEDDLGVYRHENSDRGRESAITGNAGSRIACAVIGITNRDLHPGH